MPSWAGEAIQVSCVLAMLGGLGWAFTLPPTRARAEAMRWVIFGGVIGHALGGLIEHPDRILPKLVIGTLAAMILAGGLLLVRQAARAAERD